MDRKEIEVNIKEIIDLYNSLQLGIQDIFRGIKNEGDERKILDDFCMCVGIDKNEETRFAAYSRIANLSETALELYLEKNNFEEEEKRKIIDYSYKFVCDFHSEIQAVIITVAEAKNLLSDFYLEVLKGVANVGLAFNEFYIPWRNYIVHGVNKDLEKKFSNDSDRVIGYLNENNLFDKGHNGETADRSYSALVLEGDKYISKSYSEVFPKEVKAIIEELDIFILKLEGLEDKIYDSKQVYINYFKAIRSAFLETNVDILVKKWSLVDEAWMNLKTPFQIGHPLEYYEDKYRKAVAPEWDIRVKNEVFESDVETSILNMYENIYEEIGRDKYSSSYKFSLDSFKRVQLYLTSPIFNFSSRLVGQYSAQVVPNDEVISERHGKKIFAFPEMVLESKRSEPFMKLSSKIFDKEFLDGYRKVIFSEEKVFYKIYDIETIGHEYGHTLWLDKDTEPKMNSKTGVFKKIEEYKATVGGLVMYFMNENLAPDLKKELIMFHTMRSIGLMKYREVNEVEPYYCESLIHLFILFNSGVIVWNSDKKIELFFNDETYSKLKALYIKNYRQLIDTYLEKRDAGEFLNEFTLKKNGYYLPKDEKIRDFVEYFYETYKSIGNEIDESISKEDFIK